MNLLLSNSHKILGILMYTVLSFSLLFFGSTTVAAQEQEVDYADLVAEHQGDEQEALQTQSGMYSYEVVEIKEFNGPNGELVIPRDPSFPDTQEVVVSIRNTGTKEWNRNTDNGVGEAKLAVAINDSFIPSFDRDKEFARDWLNNPLPGWERNSAGVLNRIVMTQEQVDPGNVAEFRFQIRFPRSPRSDAEHLLFRPVVEFVQWMPKTDGFLLTVSIAGTQNGEYGAELLHYGQESIELLETNKTSIEIDVRNAGNTRVYKLGTAPEGQRVLNLGAVNDEPFPMYTRLSPPGKLRANRIPFEAIAIAHGELARDYALPGEIMAFDFDITALYPTGGTYKDITLAPVVELYRWYSIRQKTLSVKVDNPCRWYQYCQQIKITPKNGDNLLVLVDKEYRLPADYAPSDLVELTSNSYSGGVENTGIFLRSDALSALEQMNDGLVSAGLERLFIDSGYRSFELQQTLYSNYVESDGREDADQYSARPGHSQHQTGRAFDTVIDDSFRYTSEYRWLKNNAHLYGFVESYPSGLRHITGFTPEPWQWIYIGEDNALEMKSLGLPLELYLYLKSFRDENVYE